MTADLARITGMREALDGERGADPAPATDGSGARVPAPTVAWLGGRQAAPSPAAEPPARPLRAVALRYDPFAGPPRVVASGRGHVAEALLARAREAGVPIEAHPDLVEVLMALRIDQVIPPALYVAVAQVLAWAYLVDERLGRQRPLGDTPRR